MPVAAATSTIKVRLTPIVLQFLPFLEGKDAEGSNCAFAMEYGEPKGEVAGRQERSDT